MHTVTKMNMGIYFVLRLFKIIWLNRRQASQIGKGITGRYTRETIWHPKAELGFLICSPIGLSIRVEKNSAMATLIHKLFHK